MRSSTLISCATLAGVATALGFACGAAITPEKKLPGAGSAGDDGTGVLARASSENSLFGLLDGAVERSRKTYGGRVFGGNTYGGTRYGNYRFQRGDRDLRSNPSRQYQAGYFPTSSGKTGNLHGTVTWPKAPKALATLPLARSRSLSADGQGCPRTIANETLRIDRRKRVAGAVVYLERIYVGRQGVLDPHNYNSALQLGGTLRLRECTFRPHVQVVAPIGARLRLLNSDRTARTWRLANGDNSEMTLDMRGFASRQFTLADQGMLEIRDRPGNAWVVVAGHPYYTVSDADGQFRLYDVPPGKYTLVVWHEPVAIRTRGDQVVYTKAVTHKSKIEVRVGKNKNIAVKLPAVK